MKLQHLILIFLAIALPIIIILSVYVQLQVDTARLKSQYDDFIINAAHETIVAFEINTNNNKHSGVADSKIRDIEASLNVFSSSMATSFGRTGASKDFIMSCVPVLVFTLYDGYYAYIPTEKEWNGAWESTLMKHELKPYVYYAKEYSNAEGTRRVTINYSLDNYVTVYYYSENSYQSRAGYLEVMPDNFNSLSDNVKNYYMENALGGNPDNFTEWFNNVINEVSVGANEENRKALGKLTIVKPTGGNAGNIAIPNKTSTFNDEKFDVIKDVIIGNLVQAMNAYGYEMPELTDSDWDLITNDVCLLAFVQGMPVRNYFIQ